MKRLIITTLAALSAGEMLAALPVPIAHWNGTMENGVVKDLSGNEYDMTTGAGVSVVNDATKGTVLHFNGLKAAWAKATGIAGIKNRTVSVWFRRSTEIPTLEDGTQNGYPCLFGDFGNLLANWSGADGQIRWCVYNGSAVQDRIYSKIVTKTPGGDSWHHVILTIKDDGTTDGATGEPNYFVAAYRNGSLCGTNTFAFSKSIQYLGSTVPFVLGNNGQASNRPFNGEIADLRLYDVALSEAQARMLWLETRTDSKVLAGYWPLEELNGEEGSPRLSPDESGYGADLSVGKQDVDLTAGVVGKGFRLSAPYDASKSGNVGYGIMSFKTSVDEIGPFSFCLWLKRDADTETKNGPNILVASSLGLLLKTDQDTTEKVNLQYANRTTGKAAKHLTSGSALKAKGEWSHLAVVCDYEYDAEADAVKLVAKVYRNGELVEGPSADVPNVIPFPIAKDTEMLIGSNSRVGSQGTRNFGGTVDEIRFYAGALTADEVKEVYRGAARVKAGDDFAVVGDRAVLRGEVASRAVEAGMPEGYAGSVRWELVSAPEGGEGVVFARSENPVCEVTLPVEGEYVFRLTTTAALAVCSDEVTVVRHASATGSVPSVSAVTANPATVAYSGVSALSATVSDGARVSWSFVSGPGAVWFQPADKAVTVASFSAAGDYILRCTAETDAGIASSDVSVTVNAELSGDVTEGLLAQWTFDYTMSDKYGTKTAAVVGDSADSWHYGAGASGQAVDTFARNDYIDTKILIPDTCDLGAEPPEADRFRALSFWLYLDSGDTNVTQSALLAFVNYNLYLTYQTPFHESPGRFVLTQMTAANADQGIAAGQGYSITADASEMSIYDRWTHVYVLLDRKNYTKQAGCGDQIWINGQRMITTGYTLNARRAGSTSYTLCLGGYKDTGSYGGANQWTSAEVSRKLPGKMDDVRIYGRQLTEGEIKFLAANSLRGNFAPCISLVSVPAKIVKRESKSISAEVADDGQIRTPTYRWEIVKGDASKVVFGDATARATTVTFNAAGDFALRLAAFDGERTTYGEVKEITVEKSGLVLLFR